MAIQQAIILAGGLGTRLRAAVPDLPKCMAPVAGKPFLYYVIRYFHRQGIRSFIFSLGYRHELIVDYLHQEFSGIPIQLSIEKEPLGTGGAIQLACQKTTDQHVLVLNGDTFFKISLPQLGGFHEQSGADCTLALKPMKKFNRYGVVELNADHSVKSFQEKRYYEEGLINGGIYALNTARFLNKKLPEKFSFEKDYLEKFYPEQHFFGIAQEAYFIDIGIPEDYARAQIEMKDE